MRNRVFVTLSWVEMETLRQFLEPEGRPATAEKSEATESRQDAGDNMWALDQAVPEARPIPDGSALGGNQFPLLFEPLAAATSYRRGSPGGEPCSYGPEQEASAGLGRAGAGRGPVWRLGGSFVLLKAHLGQVRGVGGSRDPHPQPGLCPPSSGPLPRPRPAGPWHLLCQPLVPLPSGPPRAGHTAS